VALGKYEHFKGGEYEIIAFAKDSEDLTELVVYKALYGEGDVWVRPKKEFFDTVDKPEIGYTGPRFIQIDD